MRYEDLKANGTSILLRGIEEAAGLKANCNAFVGKGRRRLERKKITKHADLPDDFIDWMNKFVDWEVESRIGYTTEEMHRMCNRHGETQARCWNVM
eukprot:scaffold2683_cov217-Skeletonema_menzelii.AAC.2